MHLSSTFQLSLYLLVALAGAMLAIGEEAFFPSGLTVPLALLALVLNERGKWRMSALVGNLLGLVALGTGGFEFFGEQADARLLAGAHFLVYITWIVLWQAKGIRQYWWLCALSLLQVSLGAVLTLATGWYGFWLLFYLALALWTLSVFTLYQGAVQFGGIVEPATPGIDSAAVEAPGRAAGDPVPATDFGLALLRRAAVRNAIQQDRPGHWIVPRFILGVIGLAVAGLALGLTLFLFIPRVSFGAGAGGVRSQGNSPGAQAVMGFSTEVRLGQIGQILESTERVMRIELFDRATETPVSIEAFAGQYGLPAPLFRGSVLERYESGRWRSVPTEMYAIMASHPRSPEMIRQEYTLENNAADVLFAMRPIHLATFDPYGSGITVNPETGVLGSPGDARGPLKYYVYSRKRRSGGDPNADQDRFGRLPGSKFLTTLAANRCLLMPDQGLERLTKLAAELTAPGKLIERGEASLPLRQALTLEQHLRDSGQYEYSLNMAVDDPERDPVDEFLIDRKRGHCEYFASALALMLRSLHIPSRLIVGFKGADFHSDGHYYEVQQRHGHAWVEAWIDDQWLIFDPTPGGREDMVRSVGERAGFWSNARSSLSSLWSTYVVSLSLNRQRESLYDPLQGSMSSSLGSARGILQGVSSAVAWIRDLVTAPERFLSPGGILAGLSSVAVIVLLASLVRGSWRKQRRRQRHSGRRSWIARWMEWLASKLTGRPPEPAGVIVAFYEQFVALVDPLGLVRLPHQTQREFARQVEASLAERLTAAGIGGFPSELVEQFYCVRFGDGPLPITAVGEIEQRLGLFEKSLRPQ
jgi:hypothetical protein